MNLRSTMLTAAVLSTLIATTAPAAISAPEPAAATAESRARLAPLVDLAAERLLLADEVAAAKYGTGTPIEDPRREQQVLDTVADLSTSSGLDPAVGIRFFQDQIEAGKDVQRGLHERWNAHPELRPAHRPDLGQEVRPRLDRISVEAVRELRATEPVRSPTTRCQMDLAASVLGTVAEHRLDALHGEALGDALSNVCR
ncbi:chorismate mutase [Saccharopolyspora sp. NFXS83]|uniref:chorismate mutase n=1 Tax=Saccharopolyspora sp. NFXS83 TaxID=2993560 RepID=UPI00224B29A1|nr:chorismate mutase [Saccharopolyspora sp. NFXS83]MCX2730056.1 chorismate mutase [Saccharopolyspora sp. NFXS83]